MRRARAVLPEVIRCVHQADAEVMLPDPVHHHARGQRIFRAGNPIGQLQAALLLWRVGRECERAEDRQRARRDRLALLHRIAAMKPVRRAGLGEVSGIDHRRLHERVAPLACLIEFSQPSFSLRGLVRREIVEAINGTRRLRCSALERFAVIGTGDELPCVGTERGLDAITCRDAVGELPFAVAAPDDAFDALRLRELQLHPAAAGFAGNPRAAVAGLAVVDVLELVNLVAGQRAGRRRLRAAGRQRNVSFPSPDFELVKARLARVARENREPDELRFDGREHFLVLQGVDRRAERAGSPALADIRCRGLRDEARQLLLQILDGAVELSGLLLLLCRHGQRAFAVFHAAKHRRHRVILAVLDGIELVRVAPRTAQRETEEGGARRARHVVELVGTLLRGEHRVGTAHDVHRAADKEPGGHVHAERVSGDLLPDELVVGLVVVECGDDVIAEAPGVGPLAVRLEAVALGKANHIQPVPAPAFTVARVIKHLVHQALEGVRLFIGEKRLHLLRRRRHAEHHEVEPADEGGAIGFGGGGEFLLGELRSDERVDGVGHWRLTIDERRNEWTFHRLKRPVRLDRIDLDAAVVRPRGALINPRAEQSNLLRRERIALGRHLRIRNQAGDQMNQRAAGAIARLNRRAVSLAALERAGL